MPRSRQRSVATDEHNHRQEGGEYLEGDSCRSHLSTSRWAQCTAVPISDAMRVCVGATGGTIGRSADSAGNTVPRPIDVNERAGERGFALRSIRPGWTAVITWRVRLRCHPASVGAAAAGWPRGRPVRRRPSRSTPAPGFMLTEHAASIHQSHPGIDGGRGTVREQTARRPRCRVRHAQQRQGFEPIRQRRCEKGHFGSRESMRPMRAMVRKGYLECMSAGNLTISSLPHPLPRLFASIVPPCSCTSSRVSARPSPRPLPEPCAQLPPRK